MVTNIHRVGHSHEGINGVSKKYNINGYKTGLQDAKYHHPTWQQSSCLKGYTIALEFFPTF